MDGVVQDEVVDKDETFYAPTMKRGDLVRVGVPLSVEDYGLGKRVTRFYWVSRVLWEDVRDFQSAPPPPPNFPYQPQEVMRDTLRGDSVMWAAEMDRKIRLNPRRSHIWSVRAISSDWKEDFILVVGLGASTLVEWSWFEAYVGLPFLRGICRFINLLKGQQEHA